MTMARFPKGEYTADGGRPEWINFIREVNGIRHGTFGPVELQEHTPRRGYSTEEYHGARVIHGPHRDEGVRVIADTDEVRAAFYVAGARLRCHIPNAEGVPVVVGITRSDRERDYSSFSDGYRPDARQELHLVTVPNLLLEHAEGWTAVDWAEACFRATNDPTPTPAPIEYHLRRELRRVPTMRSLSVSDTVTVLDETWACQPGGWIRVSPLHEVRCADCGKPAYYLGNLAIARHFDPKIDDHAATIPGEG